MTLYFHFLRRELWAVAWSTTARCGNQVRSVPSGWKFPRRQVAAFSSTEITSVTSPKSSDKASIYQELKWVSSEIRRHDKLYYLDQPEVSDDEFDALVQREQKLSTQHPDLLKVWQTESGWGSQATRQGRVGATLEDSTTRLKRNHVSPMLSLDNVHNTTQLWAWLKRIPKALTEWDGSTLVTIVTEPKLDGVSLSLRYELQEDGSATHYSLKWAATRGDGRKGQDVTAAVRQMKDIPSTLSLPDVAQDLPLVVEVRGEVVLPNTKFEELSSETSFSNARNAASGILLRKEADTEEDQMEAARLRSHLSFHAYDMVFKGVDALDGMFVRKTLAQSGFVVPFPIATTNLQLRYDDDIEEWGDATIDPMLSYHSALQQHRDSGKKTKGFDWGDFDMDGCVHKIAQPEIRRLLGRSMKSPKWAVAHKFPSTVAVSKLLDVTVQVGRTGALTPVAVLEPVEVAGVSIQRATLHNFGHLQELLGAASVPMGTPVLVRRAGDVIPQVVRRATPTEHDGIETPGGKMISLEPPVQCPACGSPVISEESSSASVGQVYRCGGPPLLCPPRAVTSLAHAFSRDALDVSGLSAARIEQLADAELLRFPSDLFNFGDQVWESITELPRWGEKSTANLQTASQRVATSGISLSRFIYALGIRHVGKHSSELVASCYGNAKSFLEAMDAASIWSGDDKQIHPLSALEAKLGLGPSLVESLLSFSKDKEMLAAAKELAKAVRVLDHVQETDNTSITPSDDSSSPPWLGFRVVFTGSITGMTRKEAHDTAKKLGAKATPGSVSKSTNLVVHGEKGGKKLETAESLGIETMPVEEFLKLAEGLDPTRTGP